MKASWSCTSYLTKHNNIASYVRRWHEQLAHTGSYLLSTCESSAFFLAGGPRLPLRTLGSYLVNSKTLDRAANKNEVRCVLSS